jgi:hypothetical protein
MREVRQSTAAWIEIYPESKALCFWPSFYSHAA